MLNVMISVKKFGKDLNVRYLILLLKSRRSKFLMKIIEACRSDLKTHRWWRIQFQWKISDFVAKTMLLNALSNENVLGSYK